MCLFCVSNRFIRCDLCIFALTLAHASVGWLPFSMQSHCLLYCDFLQQCGGYQKSKKSNQITSLYLVYTEKRKSDAEHVISPARDIPCTPAKPRLGQSHYSLYYKHPENPQKNGTYRVSYEVSFFGCKFA